LDRPQAEQRRAALAYLFWPAALYEQFVEREPASSWYRLQIRQAMRFGVRWSGAMAAALLWPLICSLLIENLTATLIAYGIAIVIDAAVFVVWLRLALRYSKQAARGKTFSLEPLRAGRTQPHGG
jgi:hypothetical protein